MVGQAGFIRHEGRKEHHKGSIWGVYVTAAARGHGVANAMLMRMLDRVRGYPGLEQVSLSVSVSQGAADVRGIIRSDDLASIRAVAVAGPTR